MLNVIKVIGLDLDGTLYPDTPEIQKRIRGKIYEKISQLCGILLEQSKNLFEENYRVIMSGSKTVAKIAQEHGKEVDEGSIIQDSLAEADILDLIEKNHYLNAMLERLAQKRDIDLLTSSEHNLALQKLSRLGIDRKIFSYFLAYQDGSKSTGEKYQIWLAKRNLKPEQYLYVGDNQKLDVDMPKSLGIRTCVIGNYEKADFQIQSILELERLLE